VRSVADQMQFPTERELLELRDAFEQQEKREARRRHWDDVCNSLGVTSVTCHEIDPPEMK
jgi:hypothetical protein